VYREKDGAPFAQTAQVLPLAFGLAPEERRAALAARLAEDVTRARGGNAYVGVLGARYLLPVLSATGHADAAFTAATQTDEPSWGYWTEKAGFTALGESWPADTRSRDHHMFGSIVQWMDEDLAGFRPLTPGYGVIEFRPAIPVGRLESAAATYESVRGPIAVSWRSTGRALQIDVTVPPTATGRVVLPDLASGPVMVRSDDGEWARAAPGVTRTGREGEGAVYEVGSGRYGFLIPRGPLK